MPTPFILNVIEIKIQKKTFQIRVIYFFDCLTNSFSSNISNIVEIKVNSKGLKIFLCFYRLRDDLGSFNA